MKLSFKNLFVADGNDGFTALSAEGLIKDLGGFYEILSHAEKNAVEGSFECPGEKIWFSGRDRVFLRAEEDASGRPIDVDDSFIIRRREGLTELIARENGYPVINNGVLGLYKACRLTPDGVHLFYLLAPAASGRRELVDDFFTALGQPSRERGVRQFTSADILSRIDSGRIHTITISCGIPSVPEKSESLSIRIRPESRPSADNCDNVDFYSCSIYREVKEGDVLAVRTEGHEGRAGVDAFGREIPVGPMRCVSFSAGENVICREKEEGVTEFVSGVDGVLDLKEHSVAVHEELHVSGDVCAETGSIDFSRDVVVDGDVRSLYHINCGGNLTVKGYIENGVSVECRGDFCAEKGIIGDKTRVLVKGSLVTDYINEAGIRVLGDVRVISNIYAAQVFCGGILCVDGKKVKSRDRGSVIGSSVTAMKGMVLHSAGSGFSKTLLTCGFDRELRARIHEMEKAVPVIERKILRLQYRIGIDLGRADIVEYLKRLPAGRKNEIRALLQEIKRFAGQKIELENRIGKMSDMVVSPDLAGLSIRVGSHLLPDTKIAFGEISAEIGRSYGPVEVVLAGGDVKFNS